MKCDKYIGMDVHQATTVVVVLDAEGKLVLETIVATEAAAIIRLVQSLSGPLRATFEETTQAAWLYEVIRAYVTEVIVCDPRRNKLLEDGSKADKVDARKLAELLRAGLLRSVYHGHEATRNLKELVRAMRRCRSIPSARWPGSKRFTARVAFEHRDAESTNPNSGSDGWICCQKPEYASGPRGCMNNWSNSGRCGGRRRRRC